MMTKPFKFWIDSETTGLSEEKDQILELAGVIESPSGEEVERFEWCLSLKNGLIPNPIAAVVNGINPYSVAWNKEAITESEAVTRLIELTERYRNNLVKPQFVAYNAEFDVGFIAKAFNRNGFRFFDYFNKSVGDPLMTARRLVSEGKILTKENSYRGRTQRSAKLEDVAAALGITYQGQAHRAIADVEVLRKVAKAINAILFMSGELVDFQVSDFRQGEVLHLVTDSTSSGIKLRHVLILENSVERQKFIAVDSSDIRDSGGVRETCVRTFNYATVVGAKESDAFEVQKLRRLLEEREGELLSWKQKTLNSSYWGKPVTVDSSIKGFEVVRALQKRLSTASDKDCELSIVKDEFLQANSGKSEKLKELLDYVADLDRSLGGDGLIHQDQELMRSITAKDDLSEVMIHLDPRGLYVVTKISLLDQAAEEQVCKTKKDIAKFLQHGSEIGENIKACVRSLPEPKVFTDIKNKAILLADYKVALAKLRAGNGNGDGEEALAAIAVHLGL